MTPMPMIARLTQSCSALHALLRNARWTNPAMEIVYRELFLRDLRRLEIEDEFYPIGAAANHSLLYVITRAFTEFPVANVLELGCGQSTRLLARLNRRLNRAAAIRSVDHDPDWAERLRAAVGHQVVVAELTRKTIDGFTFPHYAEGYFDRAMKYDFVIVDGPVVRDAATAMTRLGCLDVVETALAPDFIVVVDDAERKGEGILTDRLRALLRRKGIPFGETSVVAAKRQHIFSGGQYRAAMFF